MGRIKIRGKILSLFITVLIIFSVVVNVLIYFYFNQYVIDTNLGSGISFATKYLDEQIDGEWNIIDGKLYKGDILIDQNEALVDAVKSMTDAEFTIFMNKTRVATTVMQDGERVIGTDANKVVVEEVIDNKKQYSGEAEVVGEAFLTVYEPITSSDGEVVGMLFVGLPKYVVAEDVNGLMKGIVLATVILMAISTLVVLLFTKRVICNPLEKMKKHMGLMAGGDLTFAISSSDMSRGDEFGDMARALQNTLDSMRGMIEIVQSNSEDIDTNAESLGQLSEEMASATTDVATAIQNIAQGAEEQAEELVQIHEITREFGIELEGIVEVLEDINNNTQEIGGFVEKSTVDMDKLASTISRIANESKVNAEYIKAWGDKIGKINDITSVMNGIANQTNLLALNAAIEAARVGEAGKGFAVVADEIRSLAEESKRSSEDITELIGDVIQNGDTMISGSQVMTEELQKQIETVETALTSFGKIRDSINKIVPQMQEVNDASEQLQRDKDNMLTKVGHVAAASEEVSASTQEINGIAEELNASTEEVASTAQGLTEMTEKMMKNISVFHV